MIGSLRGTALALRTYVGTPPDETQTGTATGTLAGTTITGAWTEFSGQTGTWTASTTSCE
jgi:hypothetical protein